MELLNADCIHTILSYLDIKDLRQCKKVSNIFYHKYLKQFTDKITLTVKINKDKEITLFKVDYCYLEVYEDFEGRLVLRIEGDADKLIKFVKSNQDYGEKSINSKQETKTVYKQCKQKYWSRFGHARRIPRRKTKRQQVIHNVTERVYEQNQLTLDVCGIIKIDSDSMIFETNDITFKVNKLSFANDRIYHGSCSKMKDIASVIVDYEPLLWSVSSLSSFLQ